MRPVIRLSEFISYSIRPNYRKLMYRTFSFSFTAVVGLATSPALAAPSPDLAAVSAHLRAVDTMVADFTQTDRSGATLKGTLTLKRPGKIRFQYQKGVPLLVVGDGRALTMIDYQVRQVSRWPIAARDPKHPEFGTISIVFQRLAGAPAGLTLLGWTMVDAQNNRTAIRLANQRFNLAVSDGTFRWNDPRPQGPRR